MLSTHQREKQHTVPVAAPCGPETTTVQRNSVSQLGGDSQSLKSWAELQETDDLELARQLLSGNEDAFAVIVDRYQRLVFSVAIRIVKDEGEAEEVVQIVFMDIFRKVEKFDPSRGTLKMWVLQYAYSRSVNRRHHLANRQFYTRFDLAEVDPWSSVTGSLEGHRLAPGETARLVEQALAHLNDDQRRAIELVYFEGLTFPEAAVKTGHSLQALRHHYYRGLIKIRDFLQTNGAGGGQKPAAAGAGKIRLEVANVRARPI
jgi:RNA polymerase sigma-70 factor, ECF subfamily